MRRLAEHLRSRGLEVWSDGEIDYGAGWPEAIQNSIDSCAAFVVLMSLAGRRSDWVRREILRAQGRRKRIYPLLLDGEVFFEISDLQYEKVPRGVMPSDRWILQLIKDTKVAFEDTFELVSSDDVPPAVIRQTKVPTLPEPESVLLDGVVAAENLGGYLFTYGTGQLMVDVYRATPRIGGSYMVRELPIGEWYSLMDRQGFVLPVAVRKLREDAYYVRVDPAPLDGVRTLPSMPGY